MAAGTYQVSATWDHNGNFATDSPFTILDGSTPLATIDIDQNLAPDDLTDAGASWEILGTVSITGSTLNVELSGDANGFVVADAVRIALVP